MKVVERIKAAVDEHRRRGEHPRKVFLTLDDGRKLQVELIEEGGRVARRIEKDGIRKAVPKIDGVEVVWRSPEFKVD
jgi:hypothetical protein